jgi:hypothetical protein
MIMGESWEAKDIDGDPPADPETGGSVGGTSPGRESHSDTTLYIKS